MSPMNHFSCASAFLAILLLFATGVQAQPWSVCGCRETCGSDAWNTNADGHSCGSRIEWLMTERSFSASRACRSVAGSEFPRQCGGCNPDTCSSHQRSNYDFETQSPPVFNQAPPPNQQQNNDNSSNNNNNNNSNKCGCSSCSDQIWNRNAAGHSCGDRINWLVQSQGQSERNACRVVAGTEHVNECGLCNPDTCNAAEQQQQQAPQNFNTNTNSNAGQYQPPTELYCFPPSQTRTKYANVWGDYTVEVKEGQSCGPGDNVFSKETVSVSNNRRQLTLQLKKVGGQWHSSEVRVLMPDDQYFDYGRYSFSVKSAQVIDTRTRQLVDTKLPPSVILGLFTWDDTEDYAIHENYNHEVDVELARWNDAGDADAQFLVQPPGSPQMYRFYSGTRPNTYQQGNNVYGFEWKPAEVEWFSTAGGGESFIYNAQAAISSGQPDYTQCMPAKVEVRMNLWNLFGSSGTPTDLQDHHLVEVVIDDFKYVASGLDAVPSGGVCTKDCQCGDRGRCFQNRCTQVRTSAMVHHGRDSNSTSGVVGSATSNAFAEETENNDLFQDPIFMSILVALVTLMILTVATTVFVVLRFHTASLASPLPTTETAEKSDSHVPSKSYDEDCCSSDDSTSASLESADGAV